MAVTIKDVAKRAGVSLQTVSNTLNGTAKVRPGTRHKVLKACEELSYTPNAAARSLVTQKRNTIGLVVTNIRNPIYGDVVTIITEVAERYGYSVIVGNTKRDTISEQRTVNLLVEQRVDGVLLASGSWNSSATEMLLTANIPVVRILSHPKKLNTDYFGADNCEGMRVATNHLISLGHVDIGFITGPKSSISIQREQGFRDAMKVTELPINESWIIDGGFMRETAYKVGHKLLANMPKPTALVCASDLMAIGIIDAAIDLGLHVPHDLAIVGFDDIFVASIRMIGLTTVRFDISGLAELAILRLLKKMTDKTLTIQNRYHTIPCNLIVRGTCGSQEKSR